MTKLCYTWVGCDVLWKNANWTWSECKLIDEIIGGNLPGVPGEWAQPPWLEDIPATQLDKEKRKRFIRLLCKVKRSPEFSEEKEVKTNIKITLEDIKIVVKAVKGIDVQIFEE